MSLLTIVLSSCSVRSESSIWAQYGICFLVMLWRLSLETLLHCAFRSKAPILGPMRSDHQHMPWSTVSVFSWPPNGIWGALWSGQELGLKGAQAEKGSSQGEILPPNKAEPAYRLSCPEMEGTSSNCGVSGLWRKPCTQRKLQPPVAGALPEDCWQLGRGTLPQPHGQEGVPEGQSWARASATAPGSHIADGMKSQTPPQHVEYLFF